MTTARAARSPISPGSRLDRDPAELEEPAIEFLFWETARDSESEAMIRAYIQPYPQGKFVSLAEILVCTTAP